jgi:hypothetical protein
MKRKFLDLLEFEPRAVQPVDGHYTDNSISASVSIEYDLVKSRHFEDFPLSQEVKAAVFMIRLLGLSG